MQCFPAFRSFTSKEALFKDGRRTALATIQETEPIMTAEITGPGERASLSTLLDKDKRAITIRVDDVRGVAGFILPNDCVDVVLIRAATDASGSRQSDLLLQDVKVIAIDQIASLSSAPATTNARSRSLISKIGTRAVFRKAFGLCETSQHCRAMTNAPRALVLVEDREEARDGCG